MEFNILSFNTSISISGDLKFKNFQYFLTSQSQCDCTKCSVKMFGQFDFLIKYVLYVNVY